MLVWKIVGLGFLFFGGLCLLCAIWSLTQMQASKMTERFFPLLFIALCLMLGIMLIYMGGLFTGSSISLILVLCSLHFGGLAQKPGNKLPLRS